VQYTAPDGSPAEDRMPQRDVMCEPAHVVISIDDQGRVTHWNAAAERLYGLPAAEMIGQHIERAFRQRWLKAEGEREAADPHRPAAAERLLLRSPSRGA